MAVVEQVIGAENEFGVDGCPTADVIAERVRELYLRWQAVSEEHGPDSRKATQARSSFEAAREQLWRADGWTPPSPAQLAEMRRRSIDDHNRRLVAARAESGAAAARSISRLYASLQRQAVKAASAGARTTSHPRERRSTSNARRARAPSGDSEGSQPPPRHKRCICGCGVELTGKQRKFASRKCNARYYMRIGREGKRAQRLLETAEERSDRLIREQSCGRRCAGCGEWLAKSAAGDLCGFCRDETIGIAA